MYIQRLDSALLPSFPSGLLQYYSHSDKNPKHLQYLCLFSYYNYANIYYHQIMTEQ